MSPHEPSHSAAGIPLQAHLEELRGRCEAVARLQGGSTYYHEELGIFRSYAEESGLYLAEAPADLSRPPDDEGNEHQVWFHTDSRTYLKASPIAYLERWHLHNELFGDEVTFLGVLQSSSGLRLLIRQPAIAGTPATDEQIRRFFTDSGWMPFVIGGNIAFFDPERQIVISDTHRGNLILMDDGLLAPIDLRVQSLSGSLLDTVTRLCSTH